MSGEDTQKANILIVEDQDHVAELFETVLSKSHTVDRVANGDEALERLDDDIDIVLLDRQMPKMSGDTAIEHIESTDIDCRVAMVTGIEPDMDVIDMGFDDYLVKPVENQELLATVDRLLALDTYQELQQELSSKLVKRNVIEAEKEPEMLENHAEYRRLTEEIRDLEASLEEMEIEQEFDDQLLPD